MIKWLTFLLDAIASVTPVSQWVSESVIDSFRFGDSISELSELVSMKRRCDFLDENGAEV